VNSLRLLTVAGLVFLGACTAGVRDTQDAGPPSVSIMTFNVQNLFDNVDDPGKDDKAYLPIAAKQDPAHIAACNRIAVDSWRSECLNLDWNDAAIDHKLGVIAATIRQFPGGADIIAFQEVENARILDRLRTEHLADLGYGKPILVEGSDTRGIDVAFLSRLPLVEPPTLHSLSLPDFPEREGDTRGVLQADFLLPDGEVLTGFSVHFPAPFHPAAMREAAYEHLNGLRTGLPEGYLAFAAGDFNTTSTEMREQRMLERFVEPGWIAAHTLCDDCRGTYFYGRDATWSFLDMILFSPQRSKKTTWQIRADSVRILNEYPAQVTTEGTPNRYRSAARTGVSDHWPLVMTIELTEKQ
jgi:endonuclease/exonuclease/phosphatase family metal-dependent hydrolase